MSNQSRLLLMILAALMIGIGVIFLVALVIGTSTNAYLANLARYCGTGSDLHRCLQYSGARRSRSNPLQFEIRANPYQATDFIIISDGRQVIALINLDQESGRAYISRMDRQE